jgi:hypothetical protein
MDSTMYVNKDNQINPSPFLNNLNKPINNTPKNRVLIYLDSSNDVMNLLHDRIKMIAKDGFIMGRKGSNIAIIETDLQPEALRDKLTSGDGSKSEIFVMSFNYIGYAGWLNKSNAANVKSFFENR